MMLSSPLVLYIVFGAVILPSWRLQAEGLPSFQEDDEHRRSSWRLPSTNTAAFGKTMWSVKKLFNHHAYNEHRVLKRRQARDPVLQAMGCSILEKPETWDDELETGDVTAATDVFSGGRNMWPDLDALVAEQESAVVDAMNMAGEAGRGWSSWSPWSSCSVTCGTVGEKTRRRQCQNDPLTGITCHGEDTDTKTCKPDLLSCPETTSWGAWQDWGPCTFSCGDGVRTRERSCVVSDPGLNCPGDSAQTEPCNLQSCDLKESWTEWSEWSRCSVTCNSGHRSRERMCQDDATGVEAYQCPGKKHNTEVCDQPICSSGARVKTVHVIEGHSAMLKCLYDKMSPPVSIYWLTPDHLKITHQSQIPMYEAIGDTLNIRHTSSDMVGLYRCVVEDIHGKILMGEAPVDVLDCTTRPCRNDGMCQEVQALDRFEVRFATFRCVCPFAYSGPTCERGIGPSAIAAIFFFLVLVGAVTVGVCIVWRLRQAETKPSKLITPKESKLIVVTSRDALAVSCEESSSEAVLSDSPLRQVDLDGDISAPPQLKTSRGIGAIFPKFGWNNNNILYQPLANIQDSWTSCAYKQANTMDLSKSGSETNSASTQTRRHSGNANTNHKSEKSSYSSSGTSSGTTSSSSSTSTGTSTDTEMQTHHTSDTTTPSSLSTSDSSSSSGDSGEESSERGSMLIRYLKASRRNTAYYCPSTSSLETRLKPMPLSDRGSLKSDFTTDGSLNNSSWNKTLSDRPNRWCYQNQSHSRVALDTPKRKISNICNASSRPMNGLCNRSISMRFSYNNLPSSSALMDDSSSCQPVLESEGEKDVAVIYPTSSTTVQTVKPVYPETAIVDRNQSCALTNDHVAIPNLDPINPEIQRKDQCNSSLDSFFDAFQSPDPNDEPNFADLFQNLREKLSKEREKAAAKVNCLTSIVSESSRCHGTFAGWPSRSSTLPAYGEPWTHATSSPVDPSCTIGPPPKINLSEVLSDQTTSSCAFSSDHVSESSGTYLDTPREVSTLPSNPMALSLLPQDLGSAEIQDTDCPSQPPCLPCSQDHCGDGQKSTGVSVLKL